MAALRRGWPAAGPQRETLEGIPAIRHHQQHEQLQAAWRIGSPTEGHQRLLRETLEGMPATRYYQQQEQLQAAWQRGSPADGH